MTCLDRLEGYLREQHVAFETQHHHHTVTAAETAASEHLSPILLAKVVMAVADSRLVMLVIPTSERLDLAQVARVIGANTVGLAMEAEFARQFSDCELGAMPPFGPLYGLPVYVDHAVTENLIMVFQAGSHSDTMSILYSDFARLVQPVVADLTYRTDHVPAPAR